MSPAPPSRPRHSTLLSLLAAGVHLAGGIALLALSAAGTTALPIAVSLPVQATAPFAVVDLGAAFAVVAFIAATARLITVLPAARPSDEAGVGSGGRGLRWIEYSQTAGITVFLVAQLNGIVEAGALILIYALAAGAVVVLGVQERVFRTGSRSRAPYSAGAAIGIVPWGVVALYQVVGLVLAEAGGGPTPLVRTATIVFLAIAAAHWVSTWRDLAGRGAWADPAVGERTHILLTVVSTVAMVTVAALGPAASTTALL